MRGSGSLMILSWYLFFLGLHNPSVWYPSTLNTQVNTCTWHGTTLDLKLQLALFFGPHTILRALAVVYSASFASLTRSKLASPSRFTVAYFSVTIVVINSAEVMSKLGLYTPPAVSPTALRVMSTCAWTFLTEASRVGGWRAPRIQGELDVQSGCYAWGS